MRDIDESPFVYDQVKSDYEPKGYCQKAKRESVWCKEMRPREEPKKIQAAPLTSSQTYGWREPIDNFGFDHNRSGICHRTFVDKGHLA